MMGYAVSVGINRLQREFVPICNNKRIQSLSSSENNNSLFSSFQLCSPPLCFPLSTRLITHFPPPPPHSPSVLVLDYVKKSEALKQRLAHAAGAYPGFRSMKRLGVSLLPLDGMLVHRRSLPRNLVGFPNNSPVLIYTPGWREAQ